MNQGVRSQRLPDLLLLALLAAMAAVAWRWQPREAVWTHDGEHWLAAGACLLLWVGLAAGTAWRRWRRLPPIASVSEDVFSGIELIHASQTGFAAALAERSAASLQLGGAACRLRSIEAFNDAAPPSAGRQLWIVSTTGEGDAPDCAAGFLRRIDSAADLRGVQYGLLALGDRDYAQFCAFGRALDGWLRRSGAIPLFDPIEVDNGDEGALRHWQHQLRELIGAPELPDWEPVAYQRWLLRQRRLLNPGSLGAGVWHLELAPEDGGLDWQPGDIAEIGPRNDPAEVQAWLDASGWDSEQRHTHDGLQASLRDWLWRSHFPDPPVRATDAESLIPTLQALPHREYSIASLPADGGVHLLVREARRTDGRPGLGSGWLTRHAEMGSAIDLRIRPNPAFRLPADDRPMLLIGNGTGLAGLRALIKARVQRGHSRNWLLFGERQSAVDAFHADELLDWQRRGLLRLDRCWSRDGETPRYVQDLLHAHAAEVHAWIEAHGSAIYVCGSLNGMAGGVDAALRSIVGDQVVERLREQGGYRRDVY
jgi:sulfite reductase (NADPH) flavoprotein alpha-component